MLFRSGNLYKKDLTCHCGCNLYVDNIQRNQLLEKIRQKLIDKNYIHNGKPYQYGTAWLFKALPNNINELIASL